MGTRYLPIDQYILSCPLNNIDSELNLVNLQQVLLWMSLRVTVGPIVVLFMVRFVGM